MGAARGVPIPAEFPTRWQGVSGARMIDVTEPRWSILGGCYSSEGIWCAGACGPL